MEFFSAGRALLLTNQSAGAHLWFVLTDPDPKTRKLVMVMVVTARPFTDKTVRLTTGEHEFIRHESNVDFSSARPFPLSTLEAELKNGGLRIKEDMSPDLFKRVRQGLLDSSRTNHDVKDECLSQFAALSPPVVPTPKTPRPPRIPKR